MAATAPSWDVVAEEFQPDGTLRDIYVLHTDISHWERALAHIASRYDQVSFSGGWLGPGFPRDIGAVLFSPDPDAPLTSMFVDVGGFEVNCHFFSLEEIEFDFEPERVSDAGRLATVVDFMSGLASAVGKDVLLTYENMRDAVILRCRPGGERVERGY